MDRVEEKVLGVLGGMGPLASAHFMLRLTLLTRPRATRSTFLPCYGPIRACRTGRAVSSAAVRTLCHICCAASPGFGRRDARRSPFPATPPMAGTDEMQAAAGCPILHIVDAAADELRRLGVPGGVIGVMGTQGTLDMRLYQDRLGQLGWDCLTPRPDEMNRLVSPAIARVKANCVTEAFAPLAETVQSLAARGAAAVVLGCTEIPLGIQAGPADPLGVKIVDTIDALARAAIAWARDTSGGTRSAKKRNAFRNRQLGSQSQSHPRVGPRSARTKWWSIHSATSRRASFTEDSGWWMRYSTVHARNAGRIVRAELAQIAIGGDHGALAAAGDPAEVVGPSEHRLLVANNSQNWAEDTGLPRPRQAGQPAPQIWSPAGSAVRLLLRRGPAQHGGGQEAGCGDRRRHCRHRHRKLAGAGRARCHGHRSRSRPAQAPPFGNAGCFNPSSVVPVASPAC